jgi:prepilin-type N-terminal cleavage/methylation domain-containing protein
MSARTEPRRGFTLLELMVAGAVGLVILTAAMAAFDLQSQFARNTERLLGTQASAGLGLTMMQRDLENAGLRFRGGVQVDGGVAYAMVVRPYDNLDPATTLRNDILGAGTIPAVAPPLAGFIPGTDAFEVLMGGNVATAQRQAAQVQLVNPGAGPNQLLVRISPNPFINNELSAGGSSAPVLMFWNDDIHCMGRVVPAIVGGAVAQATVQTVDMDLAPSATAWPTNCPKPLMQVEVLQQRRRYLVYQTASVISAGVNRPARIGLHMQTNPACDPVGTGIQVCTTDLGAPSMVAEGVDDMQIAWRIFDGFAPAGLPGGVGWCQKSTADPSCGFEVAPGLWTPTIVQRAAAIYGAQINLASRGQEVFRRPNEPVPPLLNYTPTVPADGIVRSLMQTSVLFRNSVTP